MLSLGSCGRRTVTGKLGPAGSKRPTSPKGKRRAPEGESPLDDPLTLFAWTVGATLAFGLLGAVFGGLAGWISWRGGSASGTGLGRKVAGALARLFDQELSSTQRGALIGAVDGG